MLNTGGPKQKKVCSNLLIKGVGLDCLFVVSYLSLYHGRSLSAQHFHGLEHVYYSFIAHAFQYYTQCNKHTCPTNTSTEKYLTNNLYYELYQFRFQSFFLFPLPPTAWSPSCTGFWFEFTYLQCTEMGPSCPNCSLVLCTWPMKSMNPSPDLGTPCSGQSVNWNCRIVRDCPSC